MSLPIELPTSPAHYRFRYAYAAPEGLPALTEGTTSVFAPLDGIALQKAFGVLQAAQVRLPTGTIDACPLSLVHATTGRRVPVTQKQLREMRPSGSAD